MKLVLSFRTIHRWRSIQSTHIDNRRKTIFYYDVWSAERKVCWVYMHLPPSVLRECLCLCSYVLVFICTSLFYNIIFCTLFRIKRPCIELEFAAMFLTTANDSRALAASALARALVAAVTVTELLERWEEREVQDLVCREDACSSSMVLERVFADVANTEV
ncbi:hypothetical protein SRHO_G00103490 [Serrasalmus rhombeus]